MQVYIVISLLLVFEICKPVKATNNKIMCVPAMPPGALPVK